MRINVSAINCQMAQFFTYPRLGVSSEKNAMPATQVPTTQNRQGILENYTLNMCGL